MRGKNKFTFRALSVSLMAPLMGCGASLDKVVETQCPRVDVLVTADSWQQGGVTAQLQLAELTCFIDSKTDDLLAEVRVRGSVSQIGVSLPIFAAALNAQDEIVARTQVKISPSETAYRLSIPKFVYAQKASEDAKARVVVGFVLTPDQLEANRRVFAKQLGLRD
tara:strand:- start:1442 stop:1936 length:495 start_codon:yes stop_codon:yes gene_type:complete